MGLHEVTNTLWRERQLLEMLLYKLECEQLLLASGRTRWLEAATREVEVVLDGIKEAELMRAVQVEAIAADLGLLPNPTLRLLAAAAPAPWDGILEEHRRAFLELTAEIEDLAEANRSLIARGVAATRDMFERLQATWSGEPAAAGYGRDRRDQRGPSNPGPMLVDRHL
jgi:hypothetical protein